MFIKSFSKINLSLRVTKKLSSGLHDLQSYFCLVDLCDQIKIKKIKGKKNIIKFYGKFNKDVNLKDNSVINTLKALKNNKLISNQYSVYVKKNIPVFSGLGGGTSNAVFLAKYLIKDKKKLKILKLLDKNVGSDAKLFFQDQGYLENINKIHEFKKKYMMYFLLVAPDIKCSTKDVYSKVRNLSSRLKNNFRSINKKDKFMNVLKNDRNDLQLIVEKKHLNIKRLILEISKIEGCIFSRMTGSGSVCYGVFKSKKRVKTALNRIKLRYPKYWSVIAKTI